MCYLAQEKSYVYVVIYTHEVTDASLFIAHNILFHGKLRVGVNNIVSFGRRKTKSTMFGFVSHMLRG
jgi:hypothetical protein